MQSQLVPSSPRRSWPVGVISWSLLACLNTIGTLPWLRVAFPTVDLAAMLYDVGRLRAGYVPYRDTFNHHFVGYIVPFYWLAAIVPLSPVTLKVIALACHFATAVCVFLIVREVGRRDLAWLGAFLTVTTGWFWKWQGFAFNVQSFLEPIWALLLLFVVQAAVRRSQVRLFGSALVAGLLVTFDQRALLFLPLIAIPILFVPCMRRAGTVGVAAVGVAIVPVLCALYLLRAHAWDDFVRQTVVFPLYYRNYGLPADVPFPLLWLVYVAWSEPIAITLTLLGIASAAVADTRLWFRILLPAAFVCAAGYSAFGGRLFPNYFILLGTTMLLSIALVAALRSTAIRANRPPVASRPDDLRRVIGAEAARAPGHDRLSVRSADRERGRDCGRVRALPLGRRREQTKLCLTMVASFENSRREPTASEAFVRGRSRALPLVRGKGALMQPNRLQGRLLAWFDCGSSRSGTTVQGFVYRSTGVGDRELLELREGIRALAWPAIGSAS